MKCVENAIADIDHAVPAHRALQAQTALTNKRFAVP